jgi:hypothetical protein
MADVSLRAHLAALDAHELAALRKRRPDVLVEPTPGGLDELAHRLSGRDSLAHALPEMDADEVAVSRVIAVAGPLPTQAIAERLQSDVATARDTVTRLRERALAVDVDGCVALPELLAQHFAAQLQHLRPLAAVVNRRRPSRGRPTTSRPRPVGRAVAPVDFEGNRRPPHPGGAARRRPVPPA